MKYENGDYYIGEMDDQGKRHGKGKYYFAEGPYEGGYYEGMWVNDQKEGMGNLYDKFNRIMFEGEWKEN